jgi:hypothetical protein
MDGPLLGAYQFLPSTTVLASNNGFRIFTYLISGFFGQMKMAFELCHLTKVYPLLNTMYIRLMYMHGACQFLPSTSVLASKNVSSISHCYQVNDCSSKILVIRGDVHLLRHCQPFSMKKHFAYKRRNVFFFSTKILSTFCK